MNLTTHRLRIRDWQERDHTCFADMCADPDVMRFFPKVLSAEDSAAQIARVLAHHAEHGFGIWVAEDLQTQKYVGTIGLAVPTFDEWFTPCVEIGWRFAKEFWNQGLCTEAAHAVLNYAFDQLSLDKVYSFTSVLNLPSERVMQKVGMQRIGEFDHPRLEVGDRLRRHVLYVLHAETQRLAR